MSKRKILENIIELFFGSLFAAMTIMFIFVSKNLATATVSYFLTIISLGAAYWGLFGLLLKIRNMKRIIVADLLGLAAAAIIIGACVYLFYNPGQLINMYKITGIGILHILGGIFYMEFIMPNLKR